MHNKTERILSKSAQCLVLYTGLAKRVGHESREFPKSLRSNWRNNWRGGALALSPSLSLSLSLSSRIICNGVSLFHHPFNELDRYRSGIIARRIDGRKAGSSTLYSCFYGRASVALPAAAAAAAAVTSSSPSQSERLTFVDWKERHKRAENGRNRASREG